MLLAVMELCKTCHTDQQQTMTPSIQRLNLSETLQDSTQFAEILLEPYFYSEKLAEAHADLQIDTAQIEPLRQTLLANKKKSNQGRKHIVAICIAIGTIIFATQIKKQEFLKPALWGLSIVAIALSAKELYKYSEQKTIPDIYFSHRTHAKDNKISCTFCHDGATNGQHARLPSVNKCMQCHVAIQESQENGAFELTILFNRWDKKLPITWNLSQPLPQHTRFTHSKHTAKNGISCSLCHGKIEEEHIAKTQQPFTMQFCTRCHLPMYQKPNNNTQTRSECTTCHY